MVRKPLKIPARVSLKINRLNREGRATEALAERARWNAVWRYGAMAATKRIKTARNLWKAREKDRANTGTLHRGWRKTFTANLEQLDRDFYSPQGVQIVVGGILRQHPLLPVRILEIGAGNGQAAADVQQKYGGRVEVHATGLARIPEWKKHPNASHIHWHVGHAEKLAGVVAPNSIDFVHSNFGFSHVPNKRKAFEQIHRILKRGGFFLCAIDVDDDIRVPANFSLVERKRVKNRPIRGGISISNHIVYLLKKKR